MGCWDVSAYHTYYILHYTNSCVGFVSSDGITSWIFQLRSREYGKERSMYVMGGRWFRLTYWHTPWFQYVSALYIANRYYGLLQFSVVIPLITTTITNAISVETCSSEFFPIAFLLFSHEIFQKSTTGNQLVPLSRQSCHKVSWEAVYMLYVSLIPVIRKQS